ncbi:putative integral membrane protein [Phaeomoniella chlamydospora]|uniref:Putative integral membrane protein n=1 Tax=Phaeomoniella chlamydospora TaxID=158046 RepID=A0A0G2G2B4_PHACM|nr:putative integral membrane protein [Phaeomoniella chlamydospora]
MRIYYDWLPLGSLTLDYPGYYQPVISQASWSALMFNQSFVSHGHGRSSLEDGIYIVNGTYGLDRTSQYVGMTSVKDIWAGMMIWLLVILAAAVAMAQVGFFLRWVLRTVSHVQEEDLRAKNMPFTVGNVIRIVFNFFLLPIISLSMFQLVIAPQGPAYTVAIAVVVLVTLFLFSGWVMLLFARTPRRSYLFDDLPTVLLYGPLYNTYSDDAATFALIPLFVNFLRGIAVGAVQPSGIAQIILLAVSEVILALTLNAFRPFPSPTSMNIYQTILAIIRLVTIILSIAFVPSLGLTEAPKGWIGYAILLMHGAVLIFGFLLNALSTLIEVGARLAGAGGDVSGGAIRRGGLTKVFGVRQLARRAPPREIVTRQSMASEAAMLGPENDRKSVQFDHNRIRSLSASSAALLKSERASTAYDTGSAGMRHSRGSGSGQFTPTTPVRSASKTRTGSMSPGGIVGLKQADAADPYYRAPRPRRNTIDPISPAERSRGSWASGDWTKKSAGSKDIEALSEDDIGEGPSNREAVKLQADDFIDDGANDLARTKTDYAVREVDFYYGVRGPALSSGTRKLKTGPADPTGPVSSATGWFKGLFGGKTKDKAKGFEVVRSSRAPPPGLLPPMERPASSHEPYKDEPEAMRNGDSEAEIGAHSERDDESDEDFEALDSEDSDNEPRQISRVAPVPPTLPAIEAGGDIELPSRIGSKASRISRKSSSGKAPAIPRKSSRRGSSGDFTKLGFPAARLSTVPASPPASPRGSSRLYDPDNPGQRRLTPSASQRLPFSPLSNASPAKTQASLGESSADMSLLQLGDEERKRPVSAHHSQSPSSALGQLAPDIRGDRPSSMGYVPHHRAGERIHEASPDSPEFQESSAEIVD